jgi:hypothetical protein
MYAIFRKTEKHMAVINREQLLNLESDDLGELINKVPGDIEDQILLVLTEQQETVEIPDEYIQGIIDGL